MSHERSNHIVSRAIHKWERHTYLSKTLRHYVYESLFKATWDFQLSRASQQSPLKWESINYVPHQVKALPSIYICIVVDTITTSQTFQRDMQFDHQFVEKTFDTRSRSLFKPLALIPLINYEEERQNLVKSNKQLRESPHIHQKLKKIIIWVISLINWSTSNFPHII